MDIRALVLSAALVLGACGDPAKDPIGPLSRPSGGGGASNDTTTSSTRNCCGILEVFTEMRGAAPYEAPYLELWWWDLPFPVHLVDGDTVRVSFAAGVYWASLSGTPNCTAQVDGGGEVYIVAGDTARVAVALDCEPVGTLGLRAALSDGELGSNITVRLHRQDAPGAWEFLLPAGPLRQYMISAGDWTVETDVPSHCVATEVEPPAFSLAESGVVDVAIRLSCEKLTGVLHVTTSTSGPDAKLVLHTGGECLYQFDEGTWSFYSTNCIDLPANGERTLYLRRGTRTVWVSHEVAACAVLPSDSVAVEIVGGETTELAVTATCD